MSYTSADSFPVWKKVTKTFTDFSTAGLTNDITIYTLAAKEVVHSVIIKSSIAFSGGIISAYTVSVGITGNLVKYAAAFDVFQAVSNTAFGLGTAMVPTMENFGSTTAVKAAAISVTGLLNTATTGAVDFYILTSKIP